MHEEIPSFKKPTKESRIERAVCFYAKERGFLTFKFLPHIQAGMPDRMFIHNKKVFFIEFKSETGKLRAVQKMMISRLEEEGLKVYIVRSIEKGQEIIDKYFKRKSIRHVEKK